MNRPLFVARGGELRRLDAFLDRALVGQGQICFVSGEAGSGKTALLTEFARRAEAHHPELVAALGQADAQTGIGDPYLPFREVLSQLTGDADSQRARTVSVENATRLRKLVSVSGRFLVEMAPELVALFVPGAGVAIKAAKATADKAGWLGKLENLAQRPKPGEGLGGSGLEQDQVFEQYTRFLTALAEEKPLLLLLDDLQWADPSSLALLFRLGRRIGQSRILLVGSYRPEEVAQDYLGGRHPMEKVLAELKRSLGDIEVDLDQADEAERDGFVEAFLDSEPNALDEGFRRALLRHTGGQALFTVELLRAMQERGDLVQDDAGHWVAGATLDWDTLPARVEGVIEERIGRLAEELRAALTVASVEGEEFTAEVVAQVQALDTRMLVRHLSEDLQKQHRLVAAQGLRRLEAQRLALYRFQHNLFQRYLYNSLDAVERACLHEDVGKVLEALYGTQAGEVAVQLARHFAEAGLADQAVPYYQQAAEAARRVYANEEAIDDYRRALALLEVEPPKGDLSQRQREAAAQLHEGLGDVLELTGQHQEARHAYGEALARIPEGQPLWQSRLYRAIGKSWEVQYHVDEATQAYSLAETILGQAPAEPDPAWWQALIEIQLDRMWLCYWQRHGDAMTTLVEVTRPALEKYGTPVQRARFFQVLVLRGWQRDRFVASDETMAHARASVAASQQTNNLSLVTMSRFQLGFSALWRDELDEAEEALQSSLSLAKRTGDVVLQARCLTYLTIVRRRCGQFDDVRQYIAHSLAAAETAQLPVYAACARANLAWVAWRRGDLLEAEEDGRAALEIWMRDGDPMPFQWMARWPLLGTALAQGQIPEAMSQARGLLDASQQRLPDALEALMKDVVKAGEQAQTEVVHVLWNRAVEAAREMGYL